MKIQHILYAPLDLRIFFEDTQTTLLNSPGNDLSPEMRTYYDKKLIRHAEPLLVHDLFASKRNIPPRNGKKIMFRCFNPLPKALTPLTEGVTPNGQNLDVTAIEATVQQFGGYIRHSDLLDLVAVDDIANESLTMLGGQAGRTLDTITRDVITAGTNVIFAPKSDGTEVLLRTNITPDCVLTPDLIFKAAAHLHAMNATPIDDCFVAIVHPYVACDIMRHPDWIDAHKYTTPENIYKGELGKIGGVRFYRSTEAKVIANAGSNGTSVFCTMIIAANAYGTTEITDGGLKTIIKQLGSGDDPLNQRATIGWKATKTAVRLVEEYMIRIEHASATMPKCASN